MSDWNNGIIEEFRANDGRVGGVFEGRPLLLLHHTGARTGTRRLSPLMYQKVGDSYAIFASKGGAEDNPDWFYNLKAHPKVSIEVGAEVVDVRARIAQGEEQDTIWEQQKKDYPQFAGYEEKTSRPQIPVIVLDPV
ncbi:MAG TPA: nitroreductase family deazaflavin-dependent oxidoreductase [Acidimicrobiia bacterium]|nr:nitroreductase family deazaflavin-dependent oxidoreductase [Acidimicrobiia bacterium]